MKRLQLGNTYTLGLANAWRMLGCSLSHMMTLRRGLAARSPYFIILENDCRSSAPQFFWQMVKTALATMPKRWSLLQLGSATAGPAPMSRRKCVRTTICGKGRTFKLRVAERCCLAHAYLISATGAAEMLRLMESGASRTQPSCPCNLPLSAQRRRSLNVFISPQAWSINSDRQSLTPAQHARCSLGGKLWREL